MGLSYSFLEAERKTWIEHSINFDSLSRKESLNLLRNIRDGEDLWLSFTRNSWGGVDYQHWFVTNGLYFIEFGSPNLDIYKARVHINEMPRNFTKTGKDVVEVKMTQAIRDRILHVLGMCNYSLCLRNCEHVANYIIKRRWVSIQMSENGYLLEIFKSKFMKDQKRLINTFPSSIRPHMFEDNSKKMYSFIHDNFVATRFDYYLDYNENTYNILVIGPTGCGKSHLINVIFNREMCESDRSHKAVTRDIYFVRGEGNVFDLTLRKFVKKDIVVADTIGLCDTEWSDEKVIGLLKNRVSDNFKQIHAVYIIFSADRLLKNHVENIKQILRWLKYHKGDNDLRFLFVGTKADFLTDDKKAQLRKEATEMLALRPTGDRLSLVDDKVIETLIYTGFPPENFLNDQAKEEILRSWTDLHRLVRLPGNTKPISLDEKTACTIL